MVLDAFMKKILISCLLTAVIVTAALVIEAGYFIGNYCVHFGLERGTAENPQEPPRAYALLMPPEARHFDKPNYASENWNIESEDGIYLAATHFKPERATDKWVIVAHGYGCTQQKSYYIAEHYLSMGYHVLTPDLRASGLSGGRYLTLGYRESEDIVLWAKRVAELYPQAKIVLHGVSMGAATVMMAAGREDLPPEVVAAVEDCGYTNADELIAMQMENSFGLPAFPAMNLLNWRCEKVAGFNLHDAAPIDAVRHARVPILFIHGTKDTLVPPNMAEQLYAAANAPKKELLMIPGAVHAAASQADQQTYFRTIRKFVQPYMEEQK